MPPSFGYFKANSERIMPIEKEYNAPRSQPNREMTPVLLEIIKGKMKMLEPIIRLRARFKESRKPIDFINLFLLMLGIFYWIFGI
jgi:hypothetical protein